MKAPCAIPERNQAEAVFIGVLLGTAVGDALGLPAENLPPSRIRRLWSGQWRMRFLFGYGMISDDTEHTLMVAQSLLDHPQDAAAFQRFLAWKLRWWFASLPAGVGMATARACLKLWLGFPLNKCAANSAGDGAAMRSAILGAFFARNAENRRVFVRASSRLTHRGWQAETAALAIAEAVALVTIGLKQPAISQLIPILRELSAEREWQDRVTQIESAFTRGDSVAEFARSLGLDHGVSGYALHAVPVALYAWWRHAGDFRSALIAAVECGGDTDTVGAMVGALCGATGGAEAIPQEWLGHLRDWPRSVAFMRALGKRMADQTQSGHALGPVGWCWLGVIPRNVLFLNIVLIHGFRRLLPPY
jgi:ADP-ribosylglycohydrolase